MNDFYVYVLFRLDGSPCYIGKGKKGRWLVHERQGTDNPRLASIITKTGGVLPKAKLRENLTEQEALDYERSVICSIGRGKYGPLVNLTDGGDGVCGMRHNKETREKIGARTRGKPQSKEHTERIRAALRGTKRKPLSEEHKRKLSASLKRSPALLAHIADLANRSRGKPLSLKRRAEISETTKAQWADPISRARIQASLKRKKSADMITREGQRALESARKAA